MVCVSNPAFWKLKLTCWKINSEHMDMDLSNEMNYEVNPTLNSLIVEHRLQVKGVCKWGIIVVESWLSRLFPNESKMRKHWRIDHLKLKYNLLTSLLSGFVLQELCEKRMAAKSFESLSVRFSLWGTRWWKERMSLKEFQLDDEIGLFWFPDSHFYYIYTPIKWENPPSP